MNRKIINNMLYLILAAAVLTGCGLPATIPAATTPSQQDIETQVAAMLTATALVQPPATQAPTPTPQIVVEATATVPPTAEPTATLAPTATQTAAPTATTAPTATAVKDDPRTVLGGATFTDKTFKENANWGPAWENDFTKGEFKDNQLVLTSVGVDGWTASWPKVKDMYIEMTATTGECSGSDRYGLIIRMPENFESGYMVGLTCDGRYSLRYYNPEEKKYTNLINWTASDYINEGSNQTNRVGLWAEGNTLKVYVNGHLLGEVEDDTFNEEGRFGPWIGHGNTDNFKIYISEISYWSLP